MVRILTEHLESGYFSENRVLKHNYFNDDAGLRNAIRDYTVYGRSGDGSRRFLNLNGPGEPNYVTLQMFGNYSEVYGEVYFYSPVQTYPGADNIIRFYNNQQEMAAIRLTPGNHWAPRFGGGTNAPQAEGSLYATWAAWHCLEFYYKIHATTGEFTGKIDSQEAFSYVGNTTYASLTSFNLVELFAQLAPHIDVDGLVINDTTGTEDNTWPNRLLCASRDPIADMTAHNEWPVTGGGSKYPKVAEYPDNLNTYIYEIVNGHKQGFLYPDFDVPANSQPVAVITEDTGRKISDGSIKQIQRLAGVEDITGVKQLGVDEKIVQNRQTHDPNGVLWTLPTANASESAVEAIL